MNVEIHSRKSIMKLLNEDFPNNVAIISFYDPVDDIDEYDYSRVDYLPKCDHVFYVGINDIAIDELEEYNLSYDTYFQEALELAKFIVQAKQEGMNIICQCEYGESRSAGCAAAILEFFYKTGITIFADYRYCSNQLVYHKVFDALVSLGENKV